MKISIKKVKYLNHICESPSKEVMDVFYDELFKSGRYFIECHKTKITKIDSMNVRIEQAYAGCSSLHFYVSFNGLKEFHLQLNKHDRIEEFRRDKKYGGFHRYDWIRDYEISLELDMGKNGSKRRYDERWETINQKEKSKRRTNHLKTEWENHLRLEKKFKFMNQ